MGFEGIFYVANLLSSFRRKPESRAASNPLDSGFRRNDIVALFIGRNTNMVFHNILSCAIIYARMYNC